MTTRIITHPMLLKMAESYKFLTEPDDVLKCLICHEVARDPKQHEDCGKLFCEKCIWKYGIRKPCPYCRMEQPLYFRDNRSELMLYSQPFSLIGSIT